MSFPVRQGQDGSDQGTKPRAGDGRGAKTPAIAVDGGSWSATAVEVRQANTSTENAACPPGGSRAFAADFCSFSDRGKAASALWDRERSELGLGWRAVATWSLAALAQAARVAVARLFFLIADELGAETFLVAALVGLVALRGFSAAGCKPPLAFFAIDFLRGLLVLIAGQRKACKRGFCVLLCSHRSVGKQAKFCRAERPRGTLGCDILPR